MIIEKILYSLPYTRLFLLTLGYFLFLYFAIGPLFQYICKVLYRKKLLEKIAPGEVSKEQLSFEIGHSLRSIILFGFSGIPIIYLIRKGSITLLPDTIVNIITGIIILTIWNEIHFFIVHRIMHLPFFMRKVHAVHHRSVVPTVYSVYSFHWFEAVLLSTVPLTIAPFVPLCALSIALYPLASILLNYAGHCNYRFGNGTGPSWKTFGTRHAEHHFKRSKNYGFATHLLDWLYSFNINKK